MGACQSTDNGEEEEKRKRSRAIDAKLEEDSRRLRKECKILLLGAFHRLPARANFNPHDCCLLPPHILIQWLQGQGKAANQQS